MSLKTVLVTGASRGIGKAIALKFAKEGFNVVITCRKSEEELLETENTIKSLSASCLSFLGDMGDYETVKTLQLLIKKRFGFVDILINNAGISHIGLLTDMDISQWNRILQSNLTSVFNCCNLFAPDMIQKRSGKIINISSVWGVSGASCEVAYSATKGGLNTFTKALAKELAPSNIQINAIACGAIDTQMNHFLSDEDLLLLKEDIPATRLGRPEEVADLAYQLANGNDYLNGQIIQLDGAWI